jgi:hypothetical protein
MRRCPLDGLTFTASVLQSLAWPLSVLLIVVVLRKPIGAALQRVSKARVGPVEAEFDQELAEVRKEVQRSTPPAQTGREAPMAPSLPEELDRLAEASPRAAVLEAFARIETRLRELLAEAGVEVREPQSGVALARLASRHGLVSDETLNAVEGLSVMRNLAAHQPTDDLSAERARDYLTLADAILYPLRNKPRR